MDAGDAGRIIGGRYECVELIGHGGMGEVWRARDTLLQRDVAVKRLAYGDGASDEATVARSMREARLAARLNHPNAVGIYDVVVDAGLPCLVMELVSGQSLKQLVAERGRLEPVTTARIGRQVAAALSAAHRAGIIHRDVKPANVLIAEDGTAKLTDFDIARDEGDAGMTSTGTFIGTPNFLAPEIALGGNHGPPSDVWALGALVYAAVEGEPPFSTGGNALAVLNRIATTDAPAPAHGGPLTSLVVSAMRRDPAARPAAATLVHQFDEIIDNARGRTGLPNDPAPPARSAGPAVPMPPPVPAVPMPPPVPAGPHTPPPGPHTPPPGPHTPPPRGYTPPPVTAPPATFLPSGAPFGPPTQYAHGGGSGPPADRPGQPGPSGPPGKCGKSGQPGDVSKRAWIIAASVVAAAAVIAAVVVVVIVTGGKRHQADPTPTTSPTSPTPAPTSSAPTTTTPSATSPSDGCDDPRTDGTSTAITYVIFAELAGAQGAQACTKPGAVSESFTRSLDGKVFSPSFDTSTDSHAAIVRTTFIALDNRKLVVTCTRGSDGKYLVTDAHLQ
jgi:serine/threonine protein kinase